MAIYYDCDANAIDSEDVDRLTTALLKQGVWIGAAEAALRDCRTQILATIQLEDEAGFDLLHRLDTLLD